MTKYKRILSIDGGGIKGVFPSAFLADIEKTLPEPIYSYFDLIVGTSTGGIIALGLALGLTANEILDFYKLYGPKIFKGNALFLTFKQAVWRKYSHEHLRFALEKTFGDKLIGHAKTRAVVTSMNIDTGEVHLFKTAHHKRFERDYKVSAVEAAMATASAPTFFPFYKTASNFPLIDGGVWSNNPVSVAVTEALGVLNWSKDEIKILSLGCTEDLFDVGWRRKRNIGLIWAYAPKTAEVLMQGQSSGALGMANTLLGHENVVRINEKVKKGRFKLDSAKNIDNLCALGENRARNESGKIKQVFFGEPASKFVPCQSVGI